MKKIILIMAVLLASVATASAQYRYYDHNERFRYQHPHSNSRDWVAPAIMGGIIMSFGALIIHNHCWQYHQRRLPNGAIFRQKVWVC